MPVEHHTLKSGMRRFDDVTCMALYKFPEKRLAFPALHYY